jgi:hypothetical protein
MKLLNRTQMTGKRHGFSLVFGRETKGIDFPRGRVHPWRFSVICVLSLFLFQNTKAAPVEKTVLSKGTAYQTACYTLRGQEAGPTVVVIGGMHGDETAGYVVARELVKWRVTKGTLIVIPDGNPPAIKSKTREGKGNLNRCFPGRADAKPGTLARAAYELFQVVEKSRPALLLTLHESRDFHANNPARYGQTFTYDFKELWPVMNPALERANQSIKTPKHKFLHLIRPFETCPTYQAWARLHVPATSIETSRTLPLKTRLLYQTLALRAFFDEAGLGYEIPRGTP